MVAGLAAMDRSTLGQDGEGAAAGRREVQGDRRCAGTVCEDEGGVMGGFIFAIT